MSTLLWVAGALTVGVALGYGWGRLTSDERVYREGRAAGWEAAGRMSERGAVAVHPAAAGLLCALVVLYLCATFGSAM